MKETGTYCVALSSTALVVCVILIITNGIVSLNAASESCSSCRTPYPGEWGSWGTWVHWGSWGCESILGFLHLWAPWENWSGCSRTCGGGTKTRYRYRCCDKGKSQNCIEYSNCPELCLNSGTFDTQCYCTDEFFGTCCEEGKPKHCFVMYILLIAWASLFDKESVCSKISKYNITLTIEISCGKLL